MRLDLSEQKNNIPQTQNSQRQLRKLATQRVLYTKAKRILYIQMLLTMPPALIWAFVISGCPDAKVWATFYSIVITILDVALIDSLKKKFVKKAAIVQEYFDCDVLEMEWPIWKIGQQDDPELESDASQTHLRKDPGYAKLLDWYPTSVGLLPLHLGRIVCQRANLRYTYSLQRKYSYALLVLMIFLTVVVFVIGLIGGMTLSKFVMAVFSPMLPTYLWGIREYQRQTEAAKASNKLRIQAEGFYRRAIAMNLAESECTMESRRLQDEIFERRLNNPLVIDWVYNLLRDKHESQLNAGAEELVNKANESN